MKESWTLPEINYLFWLFQTISMLLTSWIVPGFKVVNVFGALLMVAALAFVNAHIWDAALFFEIPNSLTAQALTLIVANSAIFWILVKILPYIEISGLIAPLAAPIIFTVLSIAIGYAGENVDWLKIFDDSMNYINNLKSTLLQSKGQEALSTFKLFS